MFLYASAFSSYFKNRFARALGYAQEALNVSATSSDSGPYKESLEKLVTDLEKDLKKKRKIKEETKNADLRV